MPEKPTVYILFDRRTHRYYSPLGKWTRYAEDAMEYPTHRSAYARAQTLSEQEDRFIEVARTESHFRK